mmetsp:Transcript_129299/g.322307  ORF Transcript_129299/g.322307 Transcript_129299/m.322307 type:complete len:268 (+) Transcript_129299:1567-2370(+)
MARRTVLHDGVGLGPIPRVKEGSDVQRVIAIGIHAKEIQRRGILGDLMNLRGHDASKHCTHGVVWVLSLHCLHRPLQPLPNAFVALKDINLDFLLVPNGPPQNGRRILVLPNTIYITFQLILPKGVGVEVRAILVDFRRVRHPDACRDTHSVFIGLCKGIRQISETPSAQGVCAGIGGVLHVASATCTSDDAPGAKGPFLRGDDAETASVVTGLQNFHQLGACRPGRRPTPGQYSDCTEQEKQAVQHCRCALGRRPSQRETYPAMIH